MSTTPKNHGIFDENPSQDFDRDLYDLWIEALRSGDYEQTTGCLKDTHGYCCLGVLVDVAGGGAWTIHENPPIQEDYFYDYPEPAIMGLSGVLLNPVRTTHLDPSCQPRFLVKRATGGSVVSSKLVKMNDEEHLDFQKIADYIEDRVTKAGLLEESK